MSPKNQKQCELFYTGLCFARFRRPASSTQIGCKGQSRRYAGCSKASCRERWAGRWSSYWAPGKYFWALGSHAGRWAACWALGNHAGRWAITAGVSSRALQHHASCRRPRYGVAVALNQFAAATGRTGQPPQRPSAASAVRSLAAESRADQSSRRAAARCIATARCGHHALMQKRLLEAAHRPQRCRRCHQCSTTNSSTPQNIAGRLPAAANIQN